MAMTAFAPRSRALSIMRSIAWRRLSSSSSGVLGDLALAQRREPRAKGLRKAHAAHDKAEREPQVPLDSHAFQAQSGSDREGCW